MVTCLVKESARKSTMREEDSGTSNEGRNRTEGHPWRVQQRRGKDPHIVGEVTL